MNSNPLRIVCPGLEDGGVFPADHTDRGADRSPEIRLENLSPAARTLAVTLEDQSHLIKDFTHWVLWNFPAGPVIPGGLPKGERLENGALQGIAYGLHRYAGPKPPPFARHRYRLTVCALDSALDLPPSARKKDLLKAAQGHILQSGSLTARFP